MTVCPPASSSRKELGGSPGRSALRTPIRAPRTGSPPTVPSVAASLMHSRAASRLTRVLSAGSGSSAASICSSGVRQ
eukprot:7972051-Alexandrium_andersonii.AAC.1